MLPAALEVEPSRLSLRKMAPTTTARITTPTMIGMMSDDKVDSCCLDFLRDACFLDWRFFLLMDLLPF
jgi:hypothetical protein